MIHQLKIVPKYFELVAMDIKKFEVRRSDRDFKVDDLVSLNEWDGDFTGRSIIVKITYIMNDPSYVKEGFIIFGFEKEIEFMDKFKKEN